jgi:hypothetical protein
MEKLYKYLTVFCGQTANILQLGVEMEYMYQLK